MSDEIDPLAHDPYDGELIIYKSRALGPTCSPAVINEFQKYMGKAVDSINGFHDSMVNAVANAFALPASMLGVPGVSGSIIPNMGPNRLNEDPDGRRFRRLVREAAIEGGWSNRGGNARQRRKQKRKRQFIRI